MAIKVYKRNTAGRRNMSVVKADFLAKKDPEKSLLFGKKKKSGRSGGKISVRHKGGAHKRKYREVDFRMKKTGVPGVVAAIEKDPGRSAFVALINYRDGEKRYVLAWKGIAV